jgi:hypothetical protein
MPDVFINYRTGDGDRTADALDRELSHRFGEDRVFLAAKSIRPGRLFPRELITAVRRSAVLLAVIGPGWVASPGLRDADDWVRKEILEALSCAIPVIPVLDGRRIERLRPEDLPPELAEIAEAQSLRLDNKNGGADLTRIGDRLAELVPSLGDADRLAAPPAAPEGGGPHNSIGDTRGPAVQGRDFSGDTGTVAKGDHGTVHAGKGDINHNNQQTTHHNDQHFTGDGATYVQGENHGGVQHQFGDARRRRDDER